MVKLAEPESNAGSSGELRRIFLFPGCDGSALLIQPLHNKPQNVRSISHSCSCPVSPSLCLPAFSLRVLWSNNQSAIENWNEKNSYLPTSQTISLKHKNQEWSLVSGFKLPSGPNITKGEATVFCGHKNHGRQAGEECSICYSQVTNYKC